MTERGNLSCVALFRPLLALMMSRSTFGSSPAFTPITIASEVTTSAEAASRLFASFATCARPAFSPTRNSLPKFLRIGSAMSVAAFGPETMTARVPSLAPFIPPLTGASTHEMSRSRSAFETCVATPGPVVERSMTVFTAFPSISPFAPRTTSRTMFGVGRLMQTVSAVSATSFADVPASAPSATSSCTAAGLAS